MNHKQVVPEIRTWPPRGERPRLPEWRSYPSPSLESRPAVSRRGCACQRHADGCLECALNKGVFGSVLDGHGALREVEKAHGPACLQKSVATQLLSTWGTFVSAFAVLCGARTDLPDRHVCCVFWLNIAAALIQTLTAIVMVGWIMSIFWGMDMVILASE
ncbi:protein stum homolog [Leptonychotes weddellii]|uniref:Protein stum homolog n=1 Tax=Leptonychotes weddellii TaxID=9713 RepID=A0A7F8Q1P1_LEPWE|nr:protein stum homolog [Leptonychotes weddellii]